MLSKNRFTSATKKKTFSGVYLSVLFVLTFLLILPLLQRRKLSAVFIYLFYLF